MPTPHAIVAKRIRTQLRAIGVKASVTSESFSMGNAVSVSCTDLPKEMSEKVKEICRAHQYVTFSENISDERKQAIWEELRAGLLPDNKELPVEYEHNSGRYVESEGETIGCLVRREFFRNRA